MCVKKFTHTQAIAVTYVALSFYRLFVIKNGDVECVVERRVCGSSLANLDALATILFGKR